MQSGHLIVQAGHLIVQSGHLVVQSGHLTVRAGHRAGEAGLVIMPAGRLGAGTRQRVVSTGAVCRQLVRVTHLLASLTDVRRQVSDGADFLLE